jgi:hypothetical protein
LLQRRQRIEVIPRKSLICVLAITMAIPLVKPRTIGLGMDRTTVPVPMIPIK